MCQMGYKCNKLLLLFVNAFYLAISIALISIAAYSWVTARLASAHAVLGILFVGIGLLLLSILGGVAAINHHPALLFFYTALMLLLMATQYMLSISALALAHRDLAKYITKTWNARWMSQRPQVLQDIMTTFKCCGLTKEDYRKNIKPVYGEHCSGFATDQNGHLPVEYRHNTGMCGYVIETKIDAIMYHCGSVALIFCFFEMFGIWLAMKYRNMKNPFAEALHGPSITERWSRNSVARRKSDQ